MELALGRTSLVSLFGWKPNELPKASSGNLSLKHTHAYMHTHSHTHTHSLSHTQSLTHSLTHTVSHTHTHTHTQAPRLCSFILHISAERCHCVITHNPN